MASIYNFTAKTQNGNVKWNFTKFLIVCDGNIVARFEPTAKMEDVRSAVEAIL